ncbi:MAG TPA: DNA polymerase III subunit delta [Enteractinococcus helveticum]|uniref:DNA-directed DNA polymerase n=1 Tax=Enteractinococcus helveticum TaxID=1837282 RepID=A0A921FNC0_9MICC|nr:DNA polymerase III subunit delta [Enteractinococcus helveticum]HJF14102.1 DNA polymerase III subunit delta [Enteractinococcus helveticum]
MAATRRTKTSDTSWRNVLASPLILVQGSEEYIHSAVTESVKSQLKKDEPDTEIHHLSAAEYQAGELQVLASPSLFGEKKLLVFADMQKMTDAFVTDGLAYLQDPNPDVTFLGLHAGGTRGKRLLDALKKTGQFIEAKPIKSDRDRMEFLQAEFRSARRKIDLDAVRSLADSIGQDLGELAAAASQLIADTEGTISVEIVEKYYGGRVQATAFKVADAALDGQLGSAIALLRHALATGVQPVAITASFALKARQVARIIDAKMAAGQVASALGMAPWQAQRVASTARHWTPVNIAGAIELIARADAEAKGQARDADFAVERMVTKIAGLAKHR